MTSRIYSDKGMNAQMIDTVSGHGRGQIGGKAGGIGALALVSGCLARNFTAEARDPTAIARESAAKTRKPTATARRFTAKTRKFAAIARDFTAKARKATATAVGVKPLKTPLFSGF